MVWLCYKKEKDYQLMDQEIFDNAFKSFISDSKLKHLQVFFSFKKTFQFW